MTIIHKIKFIHCGLKHHAPTTYLVVQYYVDVLIGILKANPFGRIFAVLAERNSVSQQTSDKEQNSQQLLLSGVCRQPALRPDVVVSVDFNEGTPNDGSNEVEATWKVDPSAANISQRFAQRNREVHCVSDELY
jgi:hypothetical protein